MLGGLYTPFSDAADKFWNVHMDRRMGKGRGPHRCRGGAHLNMLLKKTVQVGLLALKCSKTNPVFIGWEFSYSQDGSFTKY